MHGAPFLFFFFNDTATTEIYTLSLHDALPISTGLLDAPEFGLNVCPLVKRQPAAQAPRFPKGQTLRDRKSTRLNSSHGYISYAVFCLKKKKKNNDTQIRQTAITVDKTTLESTT